MTENNESPTPTLDELTNDVGHAVLTVFLDELKWANDPWTKMNAERQDLVLRRAETRIKQAIRKGFAAMVAGEHPTARAVLDKVAFTAKGVQGTLTIADPEHRHALADHAGTQVLVVLATAERYLERMEEIRGEADQPELFREQQPDLLDPAPPEASTDTDGGTDGGGEDLTAGDAEPEDPHPGELDVATVLELLAMIDVEADADTVRTWNQATRREVVDYAGAVRMAETNPGMEVPNVPTVLAGDDEAEEAQP